MDHNQRKNLQIKGIVESGDATDNMLIVSLDVAQAWLHQPGKISHGLLSVSNDVGQVENYASRLQAQYPDLEIRPVRKVSASEGQVLDKIKGLMGLVSIVILALSSLCVNTTLMAIVGERYCAANSAGNQHHRAGGGGVRLGTGIFAGATVGINGV